MLTRTTYTESKVLFQVLQARSFQPVWLDALSNHPTRYAQVNRPTNIFPNDQAQQRLAEGLSVFGGVENTSGEPFGERSDGANYTRS
jgi:hypothetical protein